MKSILSCAFFLLFSSALPAQTSQPGLLDWLQGVWLDEVNGEKFHWKKTKTNQLSCKVFIAEKGVEEILMELVLQYTDEGATLEIISTNTNDKIISNEILRDGAHFQNNETEIKILRSGTDSMKFLFHHNPLSQKRDISLIRIQR